jgi:hypothetical protein
MIKKHTSWYARRNWSQRTFAGTRARRQSGTRRRAEEACETPFRGTMKTPRVCKGRHKGVNVPPRQGPVQFALDCPAEPYRPMRRQKQENMNDDKQSGLREQTRRTRGFARRRALGGRRPKRAGDARRRFCSAWSAVIAGPTLARCGIRRTRRAPEASRARACRAEQGFIQQATKASSVTSAFWRIGTCETETARSAFVSAPWTGLSLATPPASGAQTVTLGRCGSLRGTKPT